MGNEKEIADLKRQIKELEGNKPSFKQKVKNSASALKRSTGVVFGELGKATDKVLGEFSDVDDVIRRMPQ